MLSFLKWYLSFSKKQENYKAKIDKKVDKKKGGKGGEETDEKKK